MFREQLFEIEDGVDRLSHPPLHPYIQIWLACRKYTNGITGQPCLPGSGSYLEQDAELMLAFDLLDTLSKEIEQAKENRQKNMDAVKARVAPPPPTPSLS